MPEDAYVLVITALLPLTAWMLVSQVNPYHALVIRGILGAVAALVYALFGAADVALTEALVGTMLSITLYAVAVRSSLSMRVGILDTEFDAGLSTDEPLGFALRQLLRKHHMRLEWVTYPSVQTLQDALAAKDIHTICRLRQASEGGTSSLATESQPPYQLQTRIPRLYDLMQADLSPAIVELSHVQPVHLNLAGMTQPKSEVLNGEVQI